MYSSVSRSSELPAASWRTRNASATFEGSEARANIDRHITSARLTPRDTHSRPPPCSIECACPDVGARPYSLRPCRNPCALASAADPRNPHHVVKRGVGRPFNPARMRAQASRTQLVTNSTIADRGSTRASSRRLRTRERCRAVASAGFSGFRSPPSASSRRVVRPLRRGTGRFAPPRISRSQILVVVVVFRFRGSTNHCLRVLIVVRLFIPLRRTIASDRRPQLRTRPTTSFLVSSAYRLRSRLVAAQRRYAGTDRDARLVPVERAIADETDSKTWTGSTALTGPKRSSCAADPRPTRRSRVEGL